MFFTRAALYCLSNNIMKSSLPVSLLLAVCVHAELPPYVYEEWRAKANTVLTFETVDVTLTRQIPSKDCIRDDYYNVMGRIQNIERWKGVDANAEHQTLPELSLEGHMVMTETWSRMVEDDCRGWVGPSSPLLPTNGKCYRAFLKCPNESTPDSSILADAPLWICDLAAKGRSLEEVECPNGEC